VIGARAVRLGALGVCVAGIAGMIVTSALNHNGAAITFGIVTAVAVLCSMVATAVAADTLRSIGRGDTATAGAAAVEGRGDALAALVEDRVCQLVDTGVDEQAVRQLVGEAVRLGRTLGQPRS
jgi:hypothetical protein